MKGNLLDTHTFLWYLAGSDQLSSKAKDIIEKYPDQNFISIASLWEIAIKASLDKLTIHGNFNDLQDRIIANGFQIIPIEFEDTVLLTQLPFHHRDPFDRLIIAQSINQ